MWFIDILRTLFFAIDGIVYSFIVIVYNLFVDIAQTSIFTEEVIDLFASKVYALLGIFMLFKVSFSILSYIVSPDDFLDKTKGFSKLISNIIITFTLLLATPWIFSQAMDIQRIILKDNIIGKIFSTTETNSTVVTDAGNVMAYETFKAFYYFDEDNYSSCQGLESSSLSDDNACANELGLNENDYNKLKDTLNFAYQTSSINIYMLSDIVNFKSSEGSYVMNYTYFVSTLAGGAICLLLIVFCFDIAVRSVKLGFLRMIAPIPIVSRIDPKKGKEVFDKWVKVCINTYLDLFIRLLAIYFAIFVITQMIDLRFVDAVTGIETDVNMFVKVFIMLGALLFAKQLPKLIEDLTGLKMDGKFTLNPLKKIGEVPGVEKIGGIAGGTVAGIRAGARVGNPLLGAAMGFVGGYKSSTWAGNGKGGFMSGANSTYKQLMGKDFLNFQFKPGGKNAIKQIKEPLNQAYDIKNQLEKNLNMVAHQSSQLASNLVSNGVDVNGDLQAQSDSAQSDITSLKSDINNKIEQINELKSKISGTKSKDKLKEMHTQLSKLETDLTASRTSLETKKSIVLDIENYQKFSEQESSIRSALSKVQKDIDDLSKEKQQRQSFYGVDPSPAADIKKTTEDLKNKGINKYFE